jgi:hypothetical protein
MSAADQPARWPLVTNPLNRAGSVTQDGRLVNCFAELNPQTKQYDVIKRPGWHNDAAFTNTVGDNALGFFVWFPLPATGPSYTLSIVETAGTAKFYEDNVFIANVTFGAAVDDCRFDFIPLNTSPASLLFLKQTNNGYTWDGTTLTAIADAAYVSFRANLAPGAVYLNSRVYVATTENQIYGTSNNDDVSVWSLLNVILANNTPGYTVGLIRHLNYVLAMKGGSVEVFYDAGNSTGSPLARVDGVRIPYGITTFNSVVSYNDTLYWVSQGQGGALDGADFRVVMMKGLEPQIISTPYIERLLTNETYGTVVLFPGHRFYVIWSKTTNFSLWYDIDQGIWSEETGIVRIRQASGDQPYYQSYDGHVQISDVTDYMDYEVAGVGTPIQVDIYTPNMDFDIDREKTLSILYFNGDQVPGSSLQVRHTDDDYQSWSNFRPADLSLKKPMITDEGSFYHRAYNLRHTANTSMRLKTCGLQMDIGVL